MYDIIVVYYSHIIIISNTYRIRVITYTHFYHIPMYISIPSRGMSLLHARLFCLLPSSRTVITSSAEPKFTSLR